MRPYRPVILTLIALALLVPSLILWVIWIDVTSAYGELSHAECSALYLTRFPGILQNAVGISIIGLGSSLISMICAILSIRDPRTILRGVNVVVILAGSVLLFLTFVPVL
jgi:hypothetical protein